MEDWKPCVLHPRRRIAPLVAMVLVAALMFASGVFVARSSTRVENRVVYWHSPGPDMRIDREVDGCIDEWLARAAAMDAAPSMRLCVEHARIVDELEAVRRLQHEIAARAAYISR
jgi:hypothetical protein